MATFQPKLVTTQLVYGTIAIKTSSFDIPLVLSTHNSFPERTRTYISSDDVLSDGFNAESPVYKMVSLLFQGIGKPSQVVVGRRALNTFDLTLTKAIAEDEVFSVKLREGETFKTFSYTALGTDTATEVFAALKTAIDADATFGGKITVTDNDPTLTFTPVASTYVDVAEAEGTDVKAATSEAIVDALTEVNNSNDSYFWMLSDSHTETDVKAMAAYAEGNDRIYAFSSQDADIINGVSGNLLEDLKDLGYDQTWFTLYQEDADKEFPEAGAVGAFADATAGTSTMHGKTLKGVSTGKLSTTQRINIVNNNGNYYPEEYGVPFYRDGLTVSGQFVDTIHFGLWLKARINEAIVGRLKRRSMSMSKVSQSAEGFAILRDAIMEPINLGISREAILNSIETDAQGETVDNRPVVYIPNRADIPQNDLATRVLNDVSVEVVYNNALHYVKLKLGVILSR